MGKKLTTQQVVELLNQLNEGWPKHLTLFSDAGILRLVKTKTNEVVEDFYDISTNGGDPGSYERRGRIYLNC